jgi:hypothetical protein
MKSDSITSEADDTVIMSARKTGVRYRKAAESQLAAALIHGLDREKELYASLGPIVASIHQRFSKPAQTALPMARIGIDPAQLVDILYTEARSTLGLSVEESVRRSVKQVDKYVEENANSIASKFGLTRAEVRDYLTRSKLGRYLNRPQQETQESEVDNRTLSNGMRTETIRVGQSKPNAPRAQDRHTPIVVTYKSVDGRSYEIDISSSVPEKKIRLEDGSMATITAGRTAIMVHAMAEMAKGGDPLVVYAAIGDMVRSNEYGLDQDRTGIMDNRGEMVLLFRDVYSSQTSENADPGVEEISAFSM